MNIFSPYVSLHSPSTLVVLGPGIFPIPHPPRGPMVSASVVPFRHNLRSQLSRGFAPTSADVEDAIGEGVLRPPSDRTNVGDRVFEIG